MSVPFEVPEWLPRADPPPPPDTSNVDPHRVEGLVNRFIAGKQDALFTAPDAFYRLQGADAVDGVPGIFTRLNALRDATLDQAGDDGERAALGSRLDAHLDEARGGIDRHAAAQRDAFNRQTLSQRQALIQRAAELEHTNDDKLTGLAEASASVAQELARLTGQPEAPAMDAARSAVWRTALLQRLANRDGAGALAPFDRVKSELAPADRQRLNVLIEVARNDAIVDAWLQRETSNFGRPSVERAAADPALSPDQRAIAAVKIAAHESAQESSRVATAKGLDDQLAASSRLLASMPASYRPGTFAAIADEYDAADEPTKAAEVRDLARQEPLLLAFAVASPGHRQRAIDALSENDRMVANALLSRVGLLPPGLESDSEQEYEGTANVQRTSGEADEAQGQPGPDDVQLAADNQRQNKMVRDIVVELKLTPSQAQALHREISGQGMAYHEILQTAKDMFNK